MKTNSVISSGKFSGKICAAALLTTLCLTGVQSASAVVIYPLNNGFEAPDNTAQGGFYSKFDLSPANAGWNFDGNGFHVGIVTNYATPQTPPVSGPGGGNDYYVKNATIGDNYSVSTYGQAAVIRGGSGTTVSNPGGDIYDSAYIYQSFTLAGASLFSVTADLEFNLGTNFGGSVANPIRFAVYDSTGSTLVSDLGTFSPLSDSSFNTVTTGSASLAAGTYQLYMLGTSGSVVGSGYNASTFIDNVGFNVSAVPEPSTWALLIAGGLMLVGLKFRRNKASVKA